MITWNDLAVVGEVNYPVNGSVGGIDWIEITDRVHWENVGRVHRNLAYRDKVGFDLAALAAAAVNDAHTGSLLVAASESGHEVAEGTLQEMLLVSLNADGTLKVSAGGGGGVETQAIKNKHGSQIDTDTCLYVSDVSGGYWEVKPSDPSNQAKSLCAGFSATTLAADATGTLALGASLTGVGTTDYPIAQIIVGIDSKPAWVDPGTGAPTANYLTMGDGDWLFVIGEGRGVGAIHRFHAVAHQV